MPALFLVSISVLILDQLSKYWIGAFLSLNGSVGVIKGIFHLTLVHNKGAAFGIFKGGTVLFIFVSVFCIFLIVLLLNNNSFLKRFLGLDVQDKTVRFSLGLILGGALGNLIDRIRFSYVVDFLDFRVWPVFNFADSAITVGGVLLFLSLLKKR